MPLALSRVSVCREGTTCEGVFRWLVEGWMNDPHSTICVQFLRVAMRGRDAGLPISPTNISPQKLFEPSPRPADTPLTDCLSLRQSVSQSSVRPVSSKSLKR
eukprot:Selendium_serpulae@DN5140_c0_g3_i1.p1